MDSLHKIFIIPWGNQLLIEDIILNPADDVQENDKDWNVLDPRPFQCVPESRSVFQHGFGVA